jgi:hypothetical protein
LAERLLSSMLSKFLAMPCLLPVNCLVNQSCVCRIIMKLCDEQLLSIAKDHDSFRSFASQFQACAQRFGLIKESERFIIKVQV